jgi:hypothetical protein
MMLAKSVLSMPSTGRSMKNQTTRQQQQTLLVKLPEALKSQSQYRVSEAEAQWPEARNSETGLSGAGAAEGVCKQNRFSTLQEAIEFLEEKCGFVVVQVEIVPAVWEVVGLKGRFRATLGYNELIGFAMSELEVVERFLRRSASDLINRKFAGQSALADFENCQSSVAGSEPDLAGSELNNLNSKSAEVKA